MSKLCEDYVMCGGTDDALHAALLAVAEHYREFTPEQRALIRIQMRGGPAGSVVGDRRADLRQLFEHIDEGKN